MAWINEQKLSRLHGGRVKITQPDGQEITMLFIHRRRGSRIRMFVDTPGCKVNFVPPVEGEDLREYVRRKR